jgi:aquaporin Z
MKKYLAEFFGTFVLVFIGTGSAVIAGGEIGVLGIAFAFGIAVMTMVYAIGPISGCHINPAITVSMLFAGKIGAKDSVFYILSQILGAIVGSGILLMIANGKEGFDLSTNGLGQNGWGTGYLGAYSMTAAFITEVVLTAIFLLVIFGATSEKAHGKFAGIAIGFALIMIHIVGIQITGTSVNPARSIGPALFVGGNALNQLWLFIVAPVIGGLLGAVIYKYLIEEK